VALKSQSWYTLLKPTNGPVYLAAITSVLPEAVDEVYEATPLELVVGDALVAPMLVIAPDTDEVSARDILRLLPDTLFGVVYVPVVAIDTRFAELSELLDEVTLKPLPVVRALAVILKAAAVVWLPCTNMPVVVVFV
jgi:hypothetical protein